MSDISKDEYASRATRPTTEFEDTATYYKHLSATMTEIAAQLKRIADRLDAWDSVYKTQGGREIRSIRTTANVWTQGRI